MYLNYLYELNEANILLAQLANAEELYIGFVFAKENGSGKLVTNYTTDHQDVLVPFLDANTFETVDVYLRTKTDRENVWYTDGDTTIEKFSFDYEAFKTLFTNSLKRSMSPLPVGDEHQLTRRSIALLALALTRSVQVFTVTTNGESRLAWTSEDAKSVIARKHEQLKQNNMTVLNYDWYDDYTMQERPVHITPVHDYTFDMTN